MKKLLLLAIVAVILLVSMMGISLATSHNEKKVIIIYKTDVTDADIDDLERVGVDIKYTYNIIPGIAATIDESDIDDIELDEDVLSVVEDKIFHIFLSDSHKIIQADKVHISGATGQGIKACVIDTGIHDVHPALSPLVAWNDFINNILTPYDDHGHGTHVAGIIASKDATYKGIAPGSSLMGAKVCDSSGSCPSSAIIAATDWCVTNGAKIISMSLGGGAFTSTCDTEPTAQASNNAVDRGVTVFAASGNNGFINAISAPACGSKVIAVGAVDKSDGRTPFSNEGTKLDVVAPGASITSTVPTGTCPLCSSTGFTSATGTSMATPHASGTAALLLSANSFLSPKEVRDFMRETAKDLGVVGFDTIYGYGRIDAFSGWEAVKNQPSTNLIFFDNFQSSDFVKFVESNEFDWRIMSAREKAVPDSASGNLVAHADACTSSAGCILTLKDPIDLSKYQSATLKFWRYVDNDLDSGEFLRVQVFNGASWTTIFEWTHGRGDDDTWHQESYSLSAYLVNGFKIRFVSKESSTAEDVEIDDVLVKGIPKQIGNQPPVANAGPDQTKNDADGNGIETFTLNGSASFDPDGTIIAHEWKEGATILGNTAVITKDFTVGTHNITLTVTDNNGTFSTDTAVITVNPNQPPVANAGLDQTVSDNDNNGLEIITLNGNLSFDPDGNIVSYEWREGLVIVGVNPVISANLYLGNHTIVLTVTDNGNAKGNDTVVVTVKAANKPPIANAGPDKTVNEDQVVTFNASDSSDPDGLIVSYSWNLGDGTTKTGKVVSHSYPLNKTYIVTLNVTDNEGASASDTALVSVNNVPPIANAGPDQSGSIGQVLTFDANGSTDTPSDIPTLSYNWNFGNGTNATGKTTTHAYNSSGTYTVTLTVIDNDGASSSDTAIVTIIADAPPAAPTGLTAAADEEEIKLRWNANTEPDLSGYEIYRATSADGTFSLIATVGLVTDYIDIGVSEGTFYYKIKAFDQAGNRSPFSDVTSATVSGD